ncbi:MAG: RNA 2',3'-cyclic phosphodiesterase [archaeon]|nr:RNA 2',3'-cyclic phosphodiesterase [archaeon]
MNLRIFIAIELSEEIRRKIFHTFSRKISSQNAKIVQEKNLHITLKFLGHFAEEKIPQVVSELKEIENFEQFEITFTGIGEFDGKIIWVGAKDNELLKEIAEKINELLVMREEFSPHLTIARMRDKNKKETAKILEELQKIKFEEKFKVKEIALMESNLNGEKPEYKKIYAFKLK